MNPSPYPGTYPAPFASAHTRANIVKICLIVGAIVSGLMLLGESISLAIPPLSDNQEIGDNPMGFAITMLLLLIALPTVLVYVATVIFFCVWLYRSYDNLPAFGTPKRSLDHSAGWAVGSFFVPFINLVVPYRAVKEVWQKSIPMDEVILSAPSPPAAFPMWWMFWLLSSFVGNISFRLSFNEGVPENIATMVSIVASALSIIAAILAYTVVNEIDQRQEESSKKLRLGKFVGPPPAPTNIPMASTYMPQ